MKNAVPARWYFDLVSPCAYLHLKPFGEPHPALDLELAPKRLHTYRSCSWIAAQRR